MRKTNVMQIVRLVMMIAAVAGVIYALEYMERGIAVWFWITLLGVGFVGLLYTFRLTQRRTPGQGAAGEEEIAQTEALRVIRRTLARRIFFERAEAKGTPSSRRPRPNPGRRISP